MGITISLIIGLIIGFIVGFLVFRNNAKRLKDAELSIKDALKGGDKQ